MTRQSELLMNIKVSVVIPVYNASLYIKGLCACLKKQKFQDCEFIFVNDGSTDNSLQLLLKQAAKDSRFVVLSQDNQGSGAARNTGLQSARGEYVGFVDSDDRITSDFFLKLYDSAVRNQADIAVAEKILVISSKGKKKLKDSGISGPGLIENDQDKSRIILATGSCCNKIYKRDFLLQNALAFSTQKKRCRR